MGGGIGLGLLGGLGSLLGGGIGKGIDFGFGVANSEMALKYSRKLRRTAYQDMVHSLKQAGLNPILAAGSQPLGSSMAPFQMGTWAQSAEGMANSMRTLRTTDPEIANIEARTGEAGASTEAKRASAGKDREETVNLQIGRAGLMATYDKLVAEADATRAGAEQTRANTLLARADLELRALEGQLLVAQEGLTTANAAEARKRMEKIGAEIDKILAEIPGIERAGYGKYTGELVGAGRGLKELKIGFATSAEAAASGLKSAYERIKGESAKRTAKRREAQRREGGR